MDKPPRRRKAAEPEPPPPPEPEPTRTTGELLVVRERPTRKQPPKPTPEPAAEPAPPAQPAKPARGRSRQPAPITVTLSSTSEGEWTVEVLTGSRRSVKPQPVPAGSVASAARALGGDIEAAIEGALSAARDQQRARVEQLEAELAAARQALAELSD